jgi:succinate-semialdehyde dehydrogenase/glutarate-semialdehyde dehydrogenase
MLKSINPYTGETLKMVEELSEIELDKKIKKAQLAFELWKYKSFSDRSKFMNNISVLLKKNARW